MSVALSRDGLRRMFNIIHARKKKVENNWWNADLIAKKYGISVQYLAEQSYFCQINHGVANFDPYKSGYVFQASPPAYIIQSTQLTFGLHHK